MIECIYALVTLGIVYQCIADTINDVHEVKR